MIGWSGVSLGRLVAAFCDPVGGLSRAVIGPFSWSGDEDLLPVPVKVLAGGRLCAGGHQQCLTQRGPSVILPVQRHAPGGFRPHTSGTHTPPATAGLRTDARALCAGALST